MSKLLKLMCGIGIAVSLTACSEETAQEPTPVVKESAPVPAPVTEAEPPVKVEEQPKEKSIGEQLVEETNEPSDFLSSGENGYISDDIIMGVGEDVANLDEVISYASTNNKAELTAMVSDGRAMIVEKGTPITLIDREVFNGKVKVTETGTIGWVPVEYLSK